MDVLAWLSDPSRYFLISEVALFAFAALNVAGLCSKRATEFLGTRRGVIVVLAFAFIALLATRWPTLFSALWPPDEDEPAAIAAAITALHHPIPWRDFDTALSGPFNTYMLTLPALLGLHLSFVTTAVVTFGMQFLAIAALYGTLALCFDAGVARLAIVPPVVFWTVTIQPPFYRYSSETLSITLCTAMLWLLALAWKRGYPPGILFAIGLLGGIVPLANLQPVALDAAIVVATLAIALSVQTFSRTQKAVRAGALALGAALVPGLTLLVVGLAGSLPDFWLAYVRGFFANGAFDYAPLSFLTGAPEAGAYLDWLFAVSLGGGIIAAIRWRDLDRSKRTIVLVAVTGLAAAIYCIFVPRRAIEPYVLLGVIPVAITAALGIDLTFTFFARKRTTRAVVGVAFVLVCFWVDQGFDRRLDDRLSIYAAQVKGGDADPLVTAIKSHLQRGDRMAIWGYRPQYFVYTGTVLGTRDPYTVNQWATNALTNVDPQYYRARYLADLETNRPNGFLDAGAESFDWSDPNSRSDGYESWPDLAAIVNSNYVAAGHWHRYRFFVRRSPASWIVPPPRPAPAGTAPAAIADRSTGTAFDPLAWLSADATRYYALSEVALLAFAGLIAAGACSKRTAAFLNRRRGVAVVFGATLFVLLAGRWPAFFSGFWDYDEDESDFIALAMTALHHPIPWHDFDPLTSGPFDTYVLMLPALAGLHLSFLTTAIVTFALEVLAIWALYGALALCFDPGVARLGIVPPVVFWSITTRDEFFHYSSEVLSIFLCAATLWLLALAWRRGYPPALLFGAGVLCGIVPFAKLQSAPLGAILAAIALAVVATSPSLARRERLERALVLGIGIIAVPLLTLLAVGLSGSLHDFWVSYVLSGLAYAPFGFQPASYLLGAPEVGPYFDWLLGVTLLGLAAAVIRFRDVDAAQRGVFAAAIVVLAVAVYCVFAPKRGSEHYLLYVVIPVATTAGVAIGTLSAVAARSSLTRAILGVTFVVGCLAIDGGVVRAHNWWADHGYPTFVNAGDSDPLVTAIKAHLRAGDRLAIVGFRPQYVVFTSTVLGTRDPNTLLQSDTAIDPYWRYYRARYLADMRTNRPEGFLDAAAESFGLETGTKDGNEPWPELDALVDRDYVQVAAWHRYRFFVRRDLAGRSAPPGS